MKKEAKIVLLSGLMVMLLIVGVIGEKYLNKDEKYNIKELVLKYPLISDLKRAVVSGELDYDRLPVGAKEGLDKYDSFEKTDDVGIIKELSP